MRIKNFGLCLFLVTTVAIKIVSCDAPSIWDVLPIASQVKSLFQLITLDPSGAAKTQMNFLNEGIGPAQARSAFFLATGESKKALDIQGKCFSNLEGLVDGAPLIGHIKGGIHLLAGDHDHGISAIKSATSTTGTLLGGALLGPMGAVGAHLLTDTAITVADVFINGNKSQPHGTLAYFKDFGKMNAGQHFDALAGVAFDGWTGIKVKTQMRAHQTRHSYNPRKMEKKDTTRYAALLQDSDDSIELEEIPHSPKLTEGSEGSSGTISKFERSPELPKESSDIIKETKIDKNTDESNKLKEILFIF